MARKSIYWYLKWKISMINRNGSISLSALSIIYGNTITQLTTQSPHPHCQHLVHSLAHLTIHSLLNSLTSPHSHNNSFADSFTHSTTLPTRLAKYSVNLTHSFSPSLHVLLHSLSYIPMWTWEFERAELPCLGFQCVCILIGMWSI